MGICRLVPWSVQPRDAPSVVVDRVKTQTDILKFSNLQQVFLEIGLTVSSTAAPWKHEHRRKMMRIARTVIEAEGFSWILPGLLEQTSFRQFVMRPGDRMSRIVIGIWISVGIAGTHARAGCPSVRLVR
jgi:hypothetical protein